MPVLQTVRLSGQTNLRYTQESISILSGSAGFANRVRNQQRMESLIKALPAVLKASGAPEEVAEAACLALWKQAVGESLSGHAVPTQLRDRKLTVAVADKLWQKQLEQMRGQLLSRLNYVLGQTMVTSIELRIDPVAVAATRSAQPEARRPEKNRAMPVELVSAAAGIEDVHLRRAFLGAATSCINRVENPESEI